MWCFCVFVFAGIFMLLLVSTGQFNDSQPLKATQIAEAEDSPPVLQKT